MFRQVGRFAFRGGDTLDTLKYPLLQVFQQLWGLGTLYCRLRRKKMSSKTRATVSSLQTLKPEAVETSALWFVESH